MRARTAVRTVSLAGAALLLTTGLAPAAAVADPAFSVTRVAGADRYATAAAVALATFDTAETAVLAAGGDDRYADALAGSYLAGRLDAPVLLTASASLPAETLEVLRTLQVRSVRLLGGTTAVSTGVAADLQRRGYAVTRTAGADRYATAAAIAEALPASGVGTSAGRGRTAILTSGVDALAAAPLSVAAGLPVLLTAPASLSAPAAAAALRLGVTHLLIAGGTGAVSAGVEAQVAALGLATTRLAGRTRQETAVALARYVTLHHGFSTRHVDLARGDGFADALAGGPHAGRFAAPLLLTDSATQLGPAAQDHLRSTCTTLADAHVLGGPQAVSDTVVVAATAAGRCPATPTPSPAPSPAVPAPPVPGAPSAGPDTDDGLVVAANPDSSTADDRAVTLTGLTTGETYGLVLVRCDSVAAGPTFLAETADGSSSGFAAVTGDPTADLVSVDGQPMADTDVALAGLQISATTLVATGATASVVVDGDQAECVQLLVLFDSSTGTAAEGGQLPRLEVSGPSGTHGLAVETVDTAGRTTYTSPPTTAPVEDLRIVEQDEQTLDALTDGEEHRRTFSVTGLVPGVDYRVMLVEEQYLEFTDGGVPLFHDAEGYAHPGYPRTGIALVDGRSPWTVPLGFFPAEPRAMSSVVFTASALTSAIVIQGRDNNEAVRPLLLRERGDTVQQQGALLPLSDIARNNWLRINDDRTAAEPFALGGLTRFELLHEALAISITAPDLRFPVAEPEATDWSYDDRWFAIEGLLVGEEYRIELLDAGLVEVVDGIPHFEPDGDGLAQAGPQIAVIDQVQGVAPSDNAEDGAELVPSAGQTAVFTATDSYAFFQLDGDELGSVLPAVYRNGGTADTAPDSLADGGEHPRLEVASDGVAREPVAVGGVTDYVHEFLGINTEDVQVWSSTGNPDESSDDDRTYTVSGLLVGRTYRVELFDAGLIQFAESGAAVFQDGDEDGLADPGTAAAGITEAGGVVAGPAGSRTVDFLAEASVATFVVDGDHHGINGGGGQEPLDRVRPVVYRLGDPGADGADAGLALLPDRTAAVPAVVGGTYVYDPDYFP